eukprot:196155-Amphidinium_carterae.1
MPQWMGYPLHGDCPYSLASRCCLNCRPKQRNTYFSFVSSQSVVSKSPKTVQLLVSSIVSRPCFEILFITVGVVIARQSLPFAFADIRNSRGASSK